jgi:hypothetical protein
VNPPFSNDMSIPDLAGALPPKPQDLYRLHRLCLRIHGLMTRDIAAQAVKLAEAVGRGLRKKARRDLTQTLAEDLPVILALHAMDRLAGEPRFHNPALLELLRSLLLPCFSLSYQHLYADMQDPLKHVLARLDWYLDGDKGEPVGAFTHLAATLLGDQPHDPAPLLKHISENLLPEMDKRLELAFRYEFA